MDWVFGSIGTLIAAFGALIAYFQWRTAHQRVVLDLFDRRFQVYLELCDAIGPIVGRGTPEQKDELAFLEALRRADFLFGRDVRNYLERIWADISALGLPDSRESDDAIQARARRFRSVGDFFETFPDLLAPYMRLEQRLPSLYRPWPSAEGAKK